MVRKTARRNSALSPVRFAGVALSKALGRVDRVTLPKAESRGARSPDCLAGNAGAALQSSRECRARSVRAPQLSGANPTQPQRTSRSPAGQELQLDSDTPNYEEVAAT